ncbi:MAG: 1-acyl-sn-glycerol-3-phosphate acyltransferase [Deltaproteobacteria bacterium]|nr:1-acyl-sn-glycerol-3-phosphate acyltransferase [Deltaproteobacteria bacterium]MBW2661293.1 1-acyl-sn-glycerol-3-phosphate acyltransferase [Deltaproteobacteria bacterium]
MKIKEWINNILKNTHNYYLCYLTGKIGFLSSWLLRLFFSGIKLDKEQAFILQKLREKGIVVFVTKYKSKFEYLFYYTRYNRAGLPFPEIGFDYKVFVWQPLFHLFRVLLSRLDSFFQDLKLLDAYNSKYIEEKLLNGRSALLSLVEKKGFYRRFVKEKTDPIQYLIEMQQSIEQPIYLVPLIMFFSKKPRRSTPTLKDILFGTEEKPGKIKRLVTLFKNPEKIFIEISEPVNLKNYLKVTENLERGIEYQSLVLRRDLLVQINRHRQSTIGPTLKSREELKENILTNDRLQNFMVNHSEKRYIPIQRVHKEAEACFDEIAAGYNSVIIKIFSNLIGWIVKSRFEGLAVNYDMLNRIKNMSKKGPLVLIPCHKSHIDYLILSHILYTNNMPCPLIAAGKNLSFWPIGPIFRGSGAFFIRRTFKGAVLYSKVFVEYIFKILQEGFNIEFFIEGGRSRTGKLILPKLGLLSILLNAFNDGACDDLVFVPIYIGYDRVMEETSYLHEIEGGQKEPESILQIIKARKFLKKKYGKIYVKFHEPISIKDLLAQNNLSIQDMTQKERNAMTRNLGFRVINSINNVTVVTAHALVASALLNCAQKRFSYNHLMSHVETYMNYLMSQDANLADTLVFDSVRAVDHVLDAYVHRKFIEQILPGKRTGLSDARFKVNESKRPILEYYKNNSIAFFIPASFTALSILAKDAFQFSASDLHSEYNFLQDLFKNEFAYNVDSTSEYFVRKNIKTFINDAILMPHPTIPDTYNLTSTGFRKLKLFSVFLKPYFESYLIVLQCFKRIPQDSLNTKDFLKKIQARGNRMYKNKEIELKESLSKINYKNAVGFFIAHGIKGTEDTEQIKFYTEAIKRYLNHLRV